MAHSHLLPPLEIKASPFTLNACYIGTVCSHGNRNIDLKVPFVKQGFCVHIANSNKKLSSVKKMHRLMLQHVCFSSTQMTNMTKLILSKHYKKASKFKKIQHSYLYILFVFH